MFVRCRFETTSTLNIEDLRSASDGSYFKRMIIKIMERHAAQAPALLERPPQIILSSFLQ